MIVAATVGFIGPNLGATIIYINGSRASNKTNSHSSTFLNTHSITITHTQQHVLIIRIMGALDIARIHMVVLAFLSTGLLVSISMFEKAWNDVQSKRGSTAVASKVDKEADKTD